VCVVDLAVAGRRQYGGNSGYRDDPTRTYRFDSEVNISGSANGDLVCIRDEHALVGIGVIRSVT
jgi:putative restriction endonuclease